MNLIVFLAVVALVSATIKKKRYCKAPPEEIDEREQTMQLIAEKLERVNKIDWNNFDPSSVRSRGPPRAVRTSSFAKRMDSHAIRMPTKATLSYDSISYGTSETASNYLSPGVKTTAPVPVPAPKIHVKAAEASMTYSKPTYQVKRPAPINVNNAERLTPSSELNRSISVESPTDSVNRFNMDGSVWSPNFTKGEKGLTTNVKLPSSLTKIAVPLTPIRSKGAMAFERLLAVASQPTSNVKVNLLTAEKCTPLLTATPKSAPTPTAAPKSTPTPTVTPQSAPTATATSNTPLFLLETAKFNSISRNSLKNIAQRMNRKTYDKPFGNNQ